MYQIHIQLSKSQVQSGESLEGTVYLNVTKPTDFSSITLHVIGEEGIRYIVRSPQSGSPPKHQSKKYRKLHLKQILLLPEGDPGFVAYDNVSLLHAGNYAFPFSVKIPDILLPSMKITTPEAYIKYYLVAKLNTLYSFSEHLEHTEREEYPFQVKESYDLLMNSFNINKKVLLKPEIRKCEKTPLFDSGVVKITAEIPKTLFSFNETIPVYLTINNSSRKNIKQVNLTLNQYLKINNTPKGVTAIYKTNQICKEQYFNTSLSSRNVRLLIDQLTIPNGIEGNSNYNPNLMLSFITTSFRVFYNLNIEIVFKGIAPGFNMNVPLVIYSSPIEIFSPQPPSQNLFNPYQSIPFSPMYIPPAQTEPVNHFSYNNSIDLPPTYDQSQTYYYYPQNVNACSYQYQNPLYYVVLPQYQNPQVEAQQVNSNYYPQPAYSQYDNHLIQFPSFNYPSPQC